MARLTTKKRKSLPTKDFAGSGRSYPVDTRARAGNAKSRASQAVNAGRMSTSTEKKIDRKADKVLGKSKAKRKR